MKHILITGFLLFTSSAFAQYYMQIDTKIHQTQQSVTVFASNYVYEPIECLFTAVGVTHDGQTVTKEETRYLPAGSFRHLTIYPPKGQIFVEGKGKAYCRFLD